MHDPELVLKFWLEEVSPKEWYNSSPELDAQLRDRFMDVYEAGRDGFLGWSISPRGCLALIILLDQFSRNMFRNDGRAFATDRSARKVAKTAIDKSWDMRAAEPERQFFYLPLMHSECLMDQDRCVRLMKERLPETGADNLLHARAHREVIRKFGRFPHRNADLGRATTADEQKFLAAGGYGAVVQDMMVAA
ncbi:MAG: DUF924 family protein [Mangrovicoccus sp.]